MYRPRFLNKFKNIFSSLADENDSLLQVFEQYFNTGSNMLLFVLLANKVTDYEIALYAYLVVFIQYVVSLQSSSISIPMLRHDYGHEMRKNFKKIFTKFYMYLFLMVILLKFLLLGLDFEYNQYVNSFIFLCFTFLIIDGYRKLLISLSKIKQLVFMTLFVRISQILILFFWIGVIDLNIFSYLMFIPVFLYTSVKIIFLKINMLEIIITKIDYKPFFEHLKINFKLILATILENIPGTIALLFLTQVYGFIFISDFRKILTIFSITSPLFLAIININTALKNLKNIKINFIIYLFINLSVLIIIFNFLEVFYKFLYDDELPNFKFLKIAFVLSFLFQSANNFLKGILNSQGKYKFLLISVSLSILYTYSIYHTSFYIDYFKSGLIMWSFIPVITFGIYVFSLFKFKR